MNMNTPALLVIMDGFGLAGPGPGNAVSLADKPFLDRLMGGEEYPYCIIEASGTDVGLPAGQMGNSEVGHLNIGSGRIVYQDLSRINNAISDGSFFENPVLSKIFSTTVKTGGAVHLMGLLSDGGVHSQFDHLEALIDMAAKAGVGHIMVHPFLDGRDVSPTSGAGYVKKLQGYLARTAEKHGTVTEIASLSGRYFAMDRDNRWDRVKRAWDAIVVPDASRCHTVDMTPENVVKGSYEVGVTDEFLKPVTFSDRGVRDGDGVVFFNFRPDRARELTRAFTQVDFDRFERVRKPKVAYACMTEYDETFDLPVAFPKEIPPNVLADVISGMEMRQLHIAETEKYAHVTFFFNGGVEESKEGEQRILIPSPKVATYDLQPEMSAYEVTDALVEAIEGDAAEFYIVNYANCDMVGHTGSIEATIKAVETVDRCVERLIETIERKHGVAIVTADHGNAEKMIAEDGTPHTAHTTAPVPFAVIDATEGAGKVALADGIGRLADVAPTFLDLAGIEDVPEEWTGRSLICR